MPQELIGKRLRSMDYLSSNSVLREIDDEFQAADIAQRPDPTQNVGGQRRSSGAGILQPGGREPPYRYSVLT